MIINQICNAWEHESSYLSLSISFSRLPSSAFLCLPCQMTQKLITTQARAKAKTMTATRLFACHSSALPHVGRGEGRMGNVDVGQRKCSGYLLRARNIFTHVNSIKRSIMATPLPPQAFYVPHGAWPMEFVLHTLRGDSVAHSHQHQHTKHTDNNLAVYYSQRQKILQMRRDQCLHPSSYPLYTPHLHLLCVPLKIN